MRSGPTLFWSYSAQVSEGDTIMHVDGHRVTPQNIRGPLIGNDMEGRVVAKFVEQELRACSLPDMSDIIDVERRGALTCMGVMQVVCAECSC